MQLCLTERASRFGLRSGQVVVALAGSADARRRSGRVGDRSHAGSAREPSSSTDRNEVVHAHALHDEKPARAVGLAAHVLRGLRRHRASLARQETIDVPRCACLDHHRPLKTNEAVADLCVVMPRHALAGREGQHLQCKRATAPITRSPAASWSPRAPICAWRIVLRLAYHFGELRTRFTTDRDIRKARAMSATFTPALNDARMRFAVPSGIFSIPVILLLRVVVVWPCDDALVAAAAAVSLLGPP